MRVSSISHHTMRPSLKAPTQYSHRFSSMRLRCASSQGNDRSHFTSGRSLTFSPRSSFTHSFGNASTGNGRWCRLRAWAARSRGGSSSILTCSRCKSYPDIADTSAPAVLAVRNFIESNDRPSATKQPFQVPLLLLTMNEPRCLSLWKGHDLSILFPFFLRLTNCPTTSTMSAAALIRSTVKSLILAIFNNSP